MLQLEGFIHVPEILQSGVYALIWRREVVYVGKSKTMLVRIYSHRNAWADKRQGAKRNLPSWFPIQGVMFDSVAIRPVPLDRLDEVEREMIAKYRPRFNTRLVPKGQATMPDVIAGIQVRPPIPTITRRF